MTQNEECLELLMQDVVRIDIMPYTALKVNTPFNVQNITETDVTMLDGSEITDADLHLDSLLSLNLSGDDTADAEMKESLQHKVVEKRDISGIVRTHTLQIPIESGFQVVRAKQPYLKYTDFHIVLTTYNGTRYLAYGLPNTSQFTIEEQMGQSSQMSIKVTLMSMSGFIRISNI